MNPIITTHTLSIVAVSLCLALGSGCSLQPMDVESLEQALDVPDPLDQDASIADEREAALPAETAEASSAVRSDRYWRAHSPGRTVGNVDRGAEIVEFHKDADGNWHCKGDVDCNHMFSAGVCGGILDSVCDTTHEVECWCK